MRASWKNNVLFKGLRSENEDEFDFWLQEVWYSNFRPSPRAHVICNWIDQFRVPLQCYDISPEKKFLRLK